MFGGDQPQGFTIVELMIFILVSGILFVSAVALISGQQDKTQFSTTIHGLFAKLQQQTNFLKDGFYGAPDNFTCTVPNTGLGKPPLLTDLGPGNNAPQGTNLGCIYLGQFYQFEPSGADSAFNLFDIVGRQFQGATGTSPVVTSLNQARPTTIYDMQSYEGGYASGVTLKSVYYTDPSTGSKKQFTSLIGIISSFTPTQANSKDLQSGSGGENLIPVPVVLGNSESGKAYLNLTTAQAAKEIDTFTQDTTNPSQIDVPSLKNTHTVIDPQGGVSLCFASTNSNDIATIIMGANGNPAGLILKLSSGTCP